MRYLYHFFMGKFDALHLSIRMYDLFHVRATYDVDTCINRFLLELIDDRLPTSVDVKHSF
ncbi:hypothetical protein D3C85_1784880 [compost metagenome]